MALSDEVLDQISTYLQFVLSTPIGSFGIVLNIISFTIFLKQGVKDCISVSLVALTVSDFTSVFVGEAMVIFVLFEYLGLQTIIDPFSFGFVMVSVQAMFYSISQGILAFITLERCMCVALPLKFRDIFTFNKSVVVVIAIFVFTVCSYLPHFLTSGLHWQHDPTTNSSRIFLWIGKDWDDMFNFVNLFSNIIVETLYLVVVLVSTYVMTRGLRRSSKFRKQRAGDTQRAEVQGSARDPGVEPGTRNTTRQTDDMNKKNRRVIKTVAMLAAIYLFCNTFRLAVLYTIRFLPGSFGNSFTSKEYLVIQDVLFTVQTLNSSGNFFVYYYFNPNFKQTLKRLCMCNSLGGKV